MKIKSVAVYAKMKSLCACMVLVLLLMHDGNAYSCAVLYEQLYEEYKGDKMSPHLFIADENAVIIWDSQTKTEHFIRQANIGIADNKDFPDSAGFIVPTPSTPALEEADPTIFLAADYASRERIVPTKIHVYSEGALYAMGIAAILMSCIALFIADKDRGRRAYYIVVPMMVTLVVGLAMPTLMRRIWPVFEMINSRLGAAKDVDVVLEKDIAGLHAVVLSANDSAALVEWLNTNGYVAKPEFKAWLEPYVKDRWKITAFKLLPNSRNKQLEANAVRMSFVTDKPFFPYSEPRSNGKSETARERSFKVTIISDRIVSGQKKDKTAWNAQCMYASTSTPNDEDLSRIDSKLRRAITKGYFLDPIVLDQKDWLRLAGLSLDPINGRFPKMLTTFVENSARNGTADLEFVPAKEQTEYIRKSVDPDVFERAYDFGNPLKNTFALLLLCYNVFGVPWLYRMMKRYFQPVTPVQSVAPPV